MQPRSIEELILALVAEGVEFVVIGGMAGVLHGAPIATKDLDIVHRRTPENVGRLLTNSTRARTTTGCSLGPR